MTSDYYTMTQGKTTRTKNGDDYPIANFAARITKEIRHHDGMHTDTEYVIEGEHGKTKLPPLHVPAAQFASCGWVASGWGARCIIYPAMAREMPIAIQSLSDPKTTDVYAYTGWRDNVYLHRGGALTAKGNDTSYTVVLPNELQHVNFTPSSNPRRSVRQSIMLGTLLPSHVGWPLIMAVYRAAIGGADFGIHVSGKTGTFKSELCSLLQSHWGQGFTARHLPANWSSTAGSLEALAYRAKDMILIIDDYVPQGTAFQRSSLNRAADTIFRAQGNQAGRQRLTDTIALQTTYFPRGLIISTGEDIPEGASLRARILICEICPGDITTESLTAAQAAREHYQASMASFIQFLAQRPGHYRAMIDENVVHQRHDTLTPHARTGDILAQLSSTARIVFDWASKYLTSDERKKLEESCLEGLRTCAQQQSGFQASGDPIELFILAIRTLLSELRGHIRTRTGGIPYIAEKAGWVRVDDTSSDIPHYRAHGPTIGWTDDAELYIDALQIPSIIRASRNNIAVSQPTLLKRLKEGGLLSRVDAARSRNTIRVQCGGHNRTCICMPLERIFSDDI